MAPTAHRTLAELSEEEILAAIVPLFRQGHATLLGPGDDAAVVRASGSAVVATDSMVRGLDWRDEWSRPDEIGRKVAVQNIADIAAMGATPTGLLVSLAADPGTGVDWVTALASGIAEEAARCGASVLGGDLSSAPEGVIVVSVTALGDLRGVSPVQRSGARVGDVVAVCGSLGWSGAGLELYRQGMEPPALTGTSPEADQDRATLMGAHRTPTTPWSSGRLAAQAGATAMIDVSDGLVRDAGRIAAASGVTIDLHADELGSHFVAGRPLTSALGSEAALHQVLGGGEDHSLLACFPDLESVPDDAAAPWRVIGVVTAARRSDDGGEIRVTLDGRPQPVVGWDHFARGDRAG